MDNFFNNTNLLRIIFKWKWHLLVLTLVAIIASLIVSSPFIMKPRFKSTAYIYPSNIAPYSDESNAEQMLQWITSKDVKDSVVLRFDLAKHYGISPRDKEFASIIDYLYNKNVKISKTQYESIEISVTDVDPVIACDMVKAIIHYTDQKIRATHLVKYQEVMDVWGKAVAEKKVEIDSTKALYRQLATTYGIYNFDGQSQEITRGQLRTVDGGGAGISTKDVQHLKEGMMEKGADMLFLSGRIRDLANEYSELVKKYDMARFDIEKHFTFVNIVTPPQVADKKSYPKRVLIMLYFVVGTLFFSILAISVIEKRKEIVGIFKD